MLTTLLTLTAAAILFALGRIRSDVVALCALLVLLLSGILTPEEALSGFSNQVVIMMVGLFVVGGAIFQSGLAKRASNALMRLGGKSETRLFLMVVLSTAAIGGFVSNTGTVALMLPIVVSLATKAKVSASRLLMPLAFASSLGGMLTLIGTPPNLVAQEALASAGYGTLGFFSFLPIGIIVIAVGIIVLLPLSKWILAAKDKNNADGKSQRGKTLEQLVEEYRLEDNLMRYVVTDHSGIIGKSVAELDIYNRYAVTVMEIRRERTGKKHLVKNVSQKLAGPHTLIEAGDIIYLTGQSDKAKRFANDFLLAPWGNKKQTKDGAPQLDFYDIGLAELVLMPNTRLAGRAISESGFRSKYSVHVKAIRRHGEYITTDLANARLKAGDVLLVQGTWKSIARLSGEEEQWVVLGQPEEQQAKVTLDYKAPTAALIMLTMIISMVFGSKIIAPVTAVMLAGVLMVLTGCFRNVEAAYKTINWESIVLIAAMMPMSVALEKTGASALISGSLAGSLGAYGPTALLAGLYFTTSLLTLFISNTATAVLMTPIALSAAASMGVDATPFLLAIATSASMCFASPFSTPPNALVMQAGRYTFMDYVKVGLPLQLIIGIVMVLTLPLIYPF